MKKDWNYIFWVKHLESFGYKPGNRFKYYFYGYRPNPNIFSSMMIKDDRKNWYDSL